MEKKSFKFSLLHDTRKSELIRTFSVLVKGCAYQRDIPHPCGFSPISIEKYAKRIAHGAWCQGLVLMMKRKMILT